MPISFKVDNVEISALRDRVMFNTFAGNRSYICKDFGNELAVTSSSSSFSVSLGSGEAVICGGSMICEGEAPTLTLPANQSGYLVIRIDLAQTGDNICQFKNVSSLVQGNINNGTDLIYDLPLYQYQTNSVGVTTITDIRTITTSPTDLNISQSYSKTSTSAMSGVAVNKALQTLDGVITGTPSASKTLTSFSQVDGIVKATFNNIAITKSQVTDFPTSMTPTSHTHGNITNEGDINNNGVAIATGDRLIINDESASKIQNSSITFDTSKASYFLSQNGKFAIPNLNYELVYYNGNASQIAGTYTLSDGSRTFKNAKFIIVQVRDADQTAISPIPQVRFVSAIFPYDKASTMTLLGIDGYREFTILDETAENRFSIGTGYSARKSSFTYIESVNFENKTTTPRTKTFRADYAQNNYACVVRRIYVVY